MDETSGQFFFENLMPHGYCYMWQPGILWTNVLSDALIALAYFSIPVALLSFLKQRPDIEFKGIFLLFAAFILFCGIAHVFSIYTVWYGAYGLHGVFKAITAIVSVTTAFVLYKSLPQLVSLPSPTQLSEALKSAADEHLLRARLELDRKSAAFFKFAAESLPIGVLVVDGKRRIRMFNRTLSNMLGYTETELEGQPIHVLVGEDMEEKHEQLMKAHMSDPRKNRLMAAGRPVKAKKKSGQEIPVEISIEVQDFEGEKHAFASIVDITERTRREEEEERQKQQLARSNQELQQFAYIASHDLKEPLRKIQSFLTVFEEEAEGNMNEEQEDCIRVINDATSRMACLISDLLDLSRVEQKMEDHSDFISLESILNETKLLIQEQIDEVACDLRCNDIENVTLFGSKSLLIQLFQNLILNSIKYRHLERSPIVTVDAALGDSTVTIKVQDNGSGFPNEKREFIFEPFRRLRSREEVSGTGIGLALCKRIVEAHNGSITASGEPNRGAAFTITLPKRL